MNPVLLLILVLLNMFVLVIKKQQLKSEILSIKTFFKKEIEDLNAVFSSSHDEESNSIKSVNDSPHEKINGRLTDIN